MLVLFCDVFLVGSSAIAFAAPLGAASQKRIELTRQKDKSQNYFMFTINNLRYVCLIGENILNCILGILNRWIPLLAWPVAVF